MTCIKYFTEAAPVSKQAWDNLLDAKMFKECWINVYEGYDCKPSHGANNTTRQVAIDCAEYLKRIDNDRLLYRLHVKLK